MTGRTPTDLGTFHDSVLIFGGPYSNAQATAALLGQAEQMGIAPTRIICTGDVVAYAGDPAKTTAMIMNSGIHVLMGNCEESFGFDGADCGCGFDEGSACDLLSRQWYAHANQQLTPAHRQWMRNLPRQIRFEIAGLQVAIIHGGVSDISRWVFKSTAAADKSEEIAAIEQTGPVDVVVGGHCGLPFADILGDKLWLNAGVIGMPANDGTPRTWFTVLSPTKNAMEVGLHALTYDHRAAAKRLDALELAGAYARTLVDGRWPNMDVLPADERLRVGQPITPWTLAWPTAARPTAVRPTAVRSAAE